MSKISRYGLVAAVVTLFAIFSLASPTFLTLANLKSVAINRFAILALVSLGPFRGRSGSLRRLFSSRGEICGDGLSGAGFAIVRDREETREMTKEIRINGFAMNCAGHLSPGLWTHPRDRSASYNDIDYWTDLAKILERGKLDAVPRRRARRL